MEFVMHVLETAFQKSPAEAYRIMMQVHVDGSGIAGVYPWEIADTKLDAVIRMRPELLRFLQQDSRAECTFDDTLAGLHKLASLLP